LRGSPLENRTALGLICFGRWEEGRENTNTERGKKLYKKEKVGGKDTAV